MPQPIEKLGMLFVVATPIGNLDDFPSRAIEVLCAVDLILAEDTRTFSKLATRFKIASAVKSYYEHNEKKQTDWVISLLKQGQDIALVSEAGTPTITTHRTPPCGNRERRSPTRSWASRAGLLQRLT